MTIQIDSTGDTNVIAPILKVFRSGLDDALLDIRLSRSLKGGYLAFIAHGGNGLLGYRLTEDVYWGKTFYIDDLVVLPHLRGTGIGAALLERAKVEARALGCDHVRLCSGLSRTNAHRFYEQNGLERTSLQFSHSLSESES